MVILKYIEHKGWGYKMSSSMFPGSTINIPGGAFVDDLIMFSDDPVEFEHMVHTFSDFLSACGMSLAPKKCHYTSLNDEDPPRGDHC